MDYKNKINKRAVALRYERQRDNAPVIVSSGQGLIAEKIIALAEEHNIPIKENTSLAHILHRLSPGQEIPPELYEAVAILLTSILEIDNKVSEKRI